MKKILSLLAVMAICCMSPSCSSDDSEKKDIGNAPLQKALYIAVDDADQPSWLQEMIKASPYLKVYHSDMKGGRYLVEHPSRVKTTCELYDQKGQSQDLPTQEALDAALTSGVLWTCTHIYSFPVAIGTDEWNSLSLQERRDVSQLPDNLLVIMRTEDLIEVCLEYPFSMEYMFFDDYQAGFMAVYNQFNGLRELLSRNDLAEPFLHRLDINWQKADLIMEMLDTDKVKVGDYSLRSCMLFKLVLAQDSVLNQMNRSQLRRMLDTCMRNTRIETAYPDIWSYITHEGTMFIYSKVIHNNGGFSFKDEKEKELFDLFLEQPSYPFFDPSTPYFLFSDEFKARIMKYVEDF